MQLLQEPLLCVAAFYILFLSVIILVRLDFSITKVFTSSTKSFKVQGQKVNGQLNLGFINLGPQSEGVVGKNGTNSFIFPFLPNIKERKKSTAVLQK